MANFSSSYFKSTDGTRLYFQKWPHKNAKINLVITHGQGEHLGCYERVREALAHLPIEIYAWDMRGHGKSDGLRGYASSFYNYIEDYHQFLTKLTTEYGLINRPIYLLSHSMGGLVQAKTLAEHPDLPIAGQVLSAPLFGLAVKVPEFKNKGAELIQHLLPKLTMWNEIRNEDLSRDPEVLREFEMDTLRHNRISASVFIGSKRTMSELRATADRVKVPTLLQMSSHDPITSTPDAMELFDLFSSTDKQIKIYQDRKHEIYNDLERADVLTDLAAWFNDKINAGTTHS